MNKIAWTGDTPFKSCCKQARGILGLPIGGRIPRAIHWHCEFCANARLAIARVFRSQFHKVSCIYLSIWFCLLDFWTVWKWVSEDGVGGGIGEAGTCCSRGARNSLRYKTGARPLPDLNGQVGLQHFLPLKVSSYSGLSFPHIFGKLAFCHFPMVNIWEFLRR